jgi:AcrR family transcriptional regulator
MTSHETETPRPRRADARRNVEAILVAAERCLARDPDASMSDIAAEAGLGRVTVYGHFKSRSELVEAVVQRVLRAADEALRDVDVGGDAAAALSRLVEATWEVTVRSGSVLVAAEQALPANTVRQAHAGPLEKRVRDLIVRGQRSGEFRSDVPADWLVATVHAVVHAAANEIDAGRLDDGRAASIMASTIVGACSVPSGPEPKSVSRRRRSRPSTSRTMV